MPVVEVGPPSTASSSTIDGADAQTEGWVRALDRLGRLGVEVVVYNFMPQITEDAMVVRTDFCRTSPAAAP